MEKKNGEKVEVEIETNPEIIQGGLDNVKRRFLMVRAITELGPRPDRDHVPFEDSSEKLKWITKAEYRKLKKEEKEGEK